MNRRITRPLSVLPPLPRAGEGWGEGWMKAACISTTLTPALSRAREREQYSASGA